MHTTSPRNNTGFTVIELLVVIAIVAVLATIIVSQVTQYNDKAKNAAIKEAMNNLSTGGTAYFSDHGNYDGFVNSSQLSAVITEVLGSDGSSQADSGDSNTTPITTWCMCAGLHATSDTPSNSTYCVDSSGYRKVTTTACSSRCSSLGPISTRGLCQG